MTDRVSRLLRVVGSVLAAWVVLAPAMADEPAPLNVGYLELTDDPRYEARKAYALIGLQSRMRPYAGAELGIKDTAMIATAADTRLALDRITEDTGAALVSAVKQALTERGIHYFLMDLPAATARAVTAGTQGLDILLFNVSEDANALRSSDCAAQMIHVYPSLRMQTDALSQYLRIRAWGKVLLLTGPEDADLAFADSFRASAKRYSLRLVEDRPFELSNDPRQRGKNNVALLTATSRDYDIIVLADRNGEFARYVPFATNRPRPIMGGAGLDANAWHWTFERFGAPQLNSRFLRANENRHMSGADWAAWVAIKAIVHARVRGGSPEFEILSAYLRGQTMKIDGFKGIALNLRPWNNQLRQPILLATHNAVISTAPVEGFLHQVNDLDTLGVDEKESTCSFE